MNSSKRDFATVLVRFAGLYFAYLAAKQIATVAFFTWWVIEILGDASDGMNLSDKVSLSAVLPGTISFFVSAGIAYYLIKKGKWFIEFLCRDSTNRQDEA